MKETTNVSIGSAAFTIDVDAFRYLNDYYDDVRRRLGDGDRDRTMADLESRTAASLREQLDADGAQVVSIGMVRRSIEATGSASDFGPPRCETFASGGGGNRNYDYNCDGSVRRIRRPLRGRAIGGVCAGVAEYFNTDVAVVRLATALLVLLAGLSLWAYIIAWIVIPSQPIPRPFEDRRPGRSR